MFPRLLLITTFLVLSWTTLFSQDPTNTTEDVVKQIEMLLKTRNYKNLKNYIDEAAKTNFQIRWDINRTIIKDYREGVISITEYIPTNEADVSNVNNYVVEFLASKENIFYYRFAKKNLKDLGEKSNKNFDQVLSRLTEEAEYARFEKSFQTLYNDTINHSDLFLTSIVYGSHCGIIGAQPGHAEYMDSIMEVKNLDVVRQWLKSPNAEKQLYAFRAFRILAHEGYTLTDQEAALLKILRQKDASISSCSGCLFMDRGFKNSISEIENTTVELLKYQSARHKISVKVNENDTEEISKKKDHTLLWIFVLILGVIFFVIIYSIINRRKYSDRGRVQP
jgi:hypothetical protein